VSDLRGGKVAVSDKRDDAGPAGRRHQPSLLPDELGVLLAAHCRQATTELPPGKPGARWAADFLAVLPTACCRRLPDVIATGPKVFEFLVGQGFFAAMPSPRLVPQVLGLVAGVTPLLQARSSRQWALWLARSWDPGSPLLAAIRKRTPAHLIGLSTPAPLGPPLRSAQIRDERDRLVADLGTTVTENGLLRTSMTQVIADRDGLAAELAAAGERERRAVAAVTADRDRLAGELLAASEHARHVSRHAATDGARLKQSQEANDRLTAELAGLRVEYERMSRALAVAEETARQRVAEHELIARVLADEKLANEQLHGEMAALRRDLEAAQGAEPQAMQPLDALGLALQQFRAGRQRRADLAAGRHPDHGRLAEAEAARRQAVAVADALRVENSELRTERDGLRARCGALESGSVHAEAGALADAEQRLTQAHAELAAARQDGERLLGLLNRWQDVARDLHKIADAREVELAAAYAELLQWKAGAAGAVTVALARGLATEEMQDAQVRRPPIDVED